MTTTKQSTYNELFDRHELWLSGKLSEDTPRIRLGIKHQNVEGVEFIGRNLDESVFRNCYFSNVVKDTNFEGADFIECLFQNTVFENVSFNGAYFRHCNFVGCTFRNCMFDYAVLESVYFKECLLKDVTFYDSDRLSFYLENHDLSRVYGLE